MCFVDQKTERPVLNMAAPTASAAPATNSSVAQSGAATAAVQAFAVMSDEKQNQGRYVLSVRNEGSPKNFRSFEQSKTVVLSASGFCSQDQIKAVHAKANGLVFHWVDLMEEPHLLADGHALTFMNDKNDFNRGKSAETIAKTQIEIMTGFNKPERVLHERTKTKERKAGVKKKVKTVDFKAVQWPAASKVQSEKDSVESVGGRYHHVPLTDHDHANVVRNVDRIVKSLKVAMAADGWFHFHCHAGKGRASQVLLLAAIFKQVTMEKDPTKIKTYGQIVEPFHKEVPTGEKPTNEHKYLVQYPFFFESFYKYVKAHPDQKVTWLDWLAQQGPNDLQKCIDKIPKAERNAKTV